MLGDEASEASVTAGEEQLGRGKRGLQGVRKDVRGAERFGGYQVEAGC